MAITALLVASEGSDLSSPLVALIVVGAVLLCAAAGHGLQTASRRPRDSSPSEALARRH